jgi:hypothetical protein
MYRNPNRSSARSSARSSVRRAARVVVTASATVLLLGVGAPASAASAADPVPLAVADLPTVINNMTVWITGIIAAVATLFLTIGGTRYLMAGGDPSEVERAKGSLTILKNILGA